MKNNLRTMIGIILVILMASSVFAGCTKKDDAEQSKGSEVADTGSNGETSSTQEQKSVAQVADPMAKYEEPITVSTYFEIVPPFAPYFTEERVMSNIYQKQYLEELGINLEYSWFAAQSEEDSVQKKNVAIASGDIPDIMMVSKEQLALLAKSDLIHKDLGTVFEQYASDNLKTWTYQEGDAAMLSATYDGKIIAIPQIDSSIDTAPFLWIRQDWVEALGMEMPTTMDELYNIMVAFKNEDPDKDGQADTIGLILNKDILAMGTSDAVGLFNGFGAYPDAWIDDGSGNLVFGSIQPEIKDALAFMSKLYSEGLIEADYSVKDAMKAAELPAAGTGGIQYGAMWNAMWPLQSSLDNDPNANWQPIAIVSSTDQPARPQIRLNTNYYYVVNSDCEHPEALIKLLNFFVEKFGFAEGEEYEKYLTSDNGIPSFAIHETMFKTYNALKNLEAYRHVSEAFASGSTDQLNAEELNYYDSIMKYRNGDPSMAGTEKTFGEGGSFATMEYYYTNDLFMMDQFFGAPTETMRQKMQLIRDKENEYFTKVIMGIETVDSFDDFVNSLNQLGLTEITEEVNEWKANR